MEKSECNSFYDKTEPAVNITLVLGDSENSEDQTGQTTPPKATAAKKKSVLWIWAVSAFAALLLSPDKNVNSIDKPVTP
jgi:hypothetical protein